MFRPQGGSPAALLCATLGSRMFPATPWETVKAGTFHGDVETEESSLKLPIMEIRQIVAFAGADGYDPTY